jgi:FkbM family methyltransferase
MVQSQAPEPDALACREYLKPGDVAIDVGANWGSYTKVFSECVGPEGSVHAVEPVPETFEYLRYNVEHLKLKNVSLHQVAAENRSGTARMTIPLWHGGRRNIYESHFAEDGEIEVRSERLDDLFHDVKPALIKIDVEGADLEVVKGATNLLKSYHPVLLVELSSPGTDPLLREMGYSKTRQGVGSNRFYFY